MFIHCPSQHGDVARHDHVQEPGCEPITGVVTVNREHSGPHIVPLAGLQDPGYRFTPRLIIARERVRTIEGKAQIDGPDQKPGDPLVLQR